MKQIIGLDRDLKLDWLDLGAAFAETTPNKIELRTRLMDSLAEEIPAHFVRYKTCTVLIRTWSNVPQEHVELRNQAFEFMNHITTEQRVILHWGMLLLAYPFFRQVTSAIGTSLQTYGEVSRLQVNRKLVETWGERTTVKRAVLRVFQSLVEWNTLAPTAKADVFLSVPPCPIDELPLLLWLIEAILRARGTEIPFTTLIQAPETFPFRLKVSLSEITRSGYFHTFQQGPDLLVGTRYLSPTDSD